MTVVTFDAPGLGDRSYLISDGEVSVVVDAQRDPSAYLQEAEKLGVTIVAVLETHIHNDYVSGGLALARAAAATYVIPAGEAVEFVNECRALEGGETISVGELEIKAISTNGHTNHHLAYLVGMNVPRDDEQGGDQVVCTGGSLLVNATGRTDLLGDALAEQLARSQWRSVRHLLKTLTAETVILPTHGFGSFCSARLTPGAGPAGTVGQERSQNPAAVLDEEHFVAAVLDDLPPIPAYYRHMAPLNRKGATAPVFRPVEVLDFDGLETAVEVPRWIVDLRHKRAFAGAHLLGNLNIELGSNLATYLGWLVPWGSEIVLLAEHEAEVAEARRLISQIGWDDLYGVAFWPTDTIARSSVLTSGRVLSYPVASFSDLAVAWRAHGPSEMRVLDVRHRQEWKAGHIAGASNRPVQELAGSKSDLPTGQIWVHCAGGFRAALAASLLSSWGASPILVDDSWENALVSGLPMTEN
jgi:glyoxylase-like metal-dependent hydrolase (beta-lactamase superfamily II)/rhodanese-related sulfurtransferase